MVTTEEKKDSKKLDRFEANQNVFFKLSTCKESVQFSHSVVSDPSRSHGLQNARLPYPSHTPEAYTNSCPLRQ